jgi:hypothetical protein
LHLDYSNVDVVATADSQLTDAWWIEQEHT